jgi:membrane-associated phospholipid phosphatase
MNIKPLSFAQKRASYIIQKNIALFFSIVFHPVMLPTLFFSFSAWMIPDLLTPFSEPALQWGFIGLIFITTMAIPLAMLSIHFMLSKKQVTLKLLYLQNRKDRIYPFFHTALFYAGITYLFHVNLHLNIFICAFMGMVSIALFLTALISLFYKISAHTMALSAVTGYLFLLQLFLPGSNLLISLCVLVFVTGITASARLFLQAHHPMQIVAGCFVGVLSTSSCLLWLYA